MAKVLASKKIKKVAEKKAEKKIATPKVVKDEPKKTVKAKKEKKAKVLVDGEKTVDAKYNKMPCKFYQKVVGGKSVLEVLTFENGRVYVYSAKKIKALGNARISKKQNEPRPFQYHVTKDVYEDAMKKGE